MKKIFSLVLVLLILCASVTAYAAKEPVLSLQQEGEIDADSVVTLQVVLADLSEFGTLTFDVNYDPQMLELVDYAPSYEVLSIVEANDPKPGQITVAAVSMQSPDSGGVLLTMRFHVLQGGSTVRLNLKEATKADTQNTDLLDFVKENAALSLTVGAVSAQSGAFANVNERSGDGSASAGAESSSESSQVPNGEIQSGDEVLENTENLSEDDRAGTKIINELKNIAVAAKKHIWWLVAVAVILAAVATIVVTLKKRKTKKE